MLGLTACDEATIRQMDAEYAARQAGGAEAASQATAVTQAPDLTRYGETTDNGFRVKAIPVAEVPPEFLRQEVVYRSREAVGTVIIDPAHKHLYLVTAPGRALRYGIAVGREGFGWSGVANVTGRTTWPRWTPPPEMIARRPELERYRDGQAGGPTNPLGARAIYLKTNGVDYGYRIHGTPEWESIGKDASSGCFRMLNQDVMDLYTRVPDGAKVVVLNPDGTLPDALYLPGKTVNLTPPAPEPVPAPPPAG
ncbi:L,D-transpeptidase [Stagnihabitans tardus]|uniref:L,D-transpeptidase family protein n=1 Tax=Stagnihabitans tardus TaxID=2699202 RepID=A0AAE4YF74_9RHOB|nr:L,D-transpeptidase [Stagnihabitans tardus]NBZ88780.1 L,D-transpeptidase family protein [Stagnihabitans tardus]